jgi:hypothetical protein
VESSVAVQWLTFAVMILIQALASLAVLFKVGKFVGKFENQVEGHEKRIENLEAIRCPHVECPLKLDLQMRQMIQQEGEGT